MELAILLFMLLLLGGAVAVAIRVVRWIAEPIESLARSRQARTQFTLADLLVLFAMLQLAVGTVHYLVMRGAGPGSGGRVPGAYGLDAFAALFTVLCWWCGASMVSRAGIQRSWHRIVVLAFVVPVGIASCVAIVGLTVFAAGCAWEREFTGGAIATGILCVLLICVCACGDLTRWIAAKYQPLDRPV